MRTEKEKARLMKLYQPPSDNFSVIDVPDMQFVMIDGEGSPDGEQYADAVKWLFAAVYPIKRIAKERMGKDFLEPPLECLFWADDLADFIEGNRDKLKWRLMIVLGEWVSDDMFADAITTTTERLGETPASLRLERFEEGKCVQIMYVGDYSEEGGALARRMHGEYLPQHNLVPNGHHHEIYLTDVNRVAREKWRTIVRQPVR